MSFLLRFYFALTLVLFPVVFFPNHAGADTQKYDLAYAWGKDLDSVLDYMEKIEQLFDSDVANKLKIVKKGNEYGVIYDCNLDVVDILKVIVQHGGVLQDEGLDQAFAIKDKGYHELYNVSYGYGPNLEAMKKRYHTIYSYLGKSVGKDLYIEQDEKGNYTLIYRRRGDRSSTATVARRHSRLLKKRGITTSIVQELNSPVVYGESTFLHGKEGDQNSEPLVEAASQPEPATRPKPKSPPSLAQTAAETPIILRPGNIKVRAGTTKSNVEPGRLATKSSPTPRPSMTLKTSSSSGLYIEKKVEKYIKQLRQKGGLRGDEKTSWVVYDLNRDVSLVDINADQSFQAASMIKPFIALAFFHKVKQGQLKYGPKSRKKMEAMIQRSNNPATNWVMRVVGGPASCQKLLTTHYPHLFKNIDIVEYIPQGGRTYRNKALPSDYIRFLRALWNKQLPYGQEIRRLMSLPGRDRLYHGTPIPQGTLVYNKTGTTAHLCGDMGILAPKTKGNHRYPYAIVGIIERSSRPSNYKRWMQSRGGVIRKISTLVYKDLKKQHALL